VAALLYGATGNDVVRSNRAGFGAPQVRDEPAVGDYALTFDILICRAATETGREARFYKLTPLGRKQLGEQRANWERLSVAISGILNTAE
jgi:hypothetical protein